MARFSQTVLEFVGENEIFNDAADSPPLTVYTGRRLLSQPRERDRQNQLIYEFKK